MDLWRLGLCLGISFSCIYWGEAAELGSSKVTALRNCVDKYEGEVKKPAAVGDSVVQGDSITTKENALVELSCSDSSIVRLGENSVFSYNSKERLVTVDKGTFLMHTPPGGGGVTITSGGVTGAISGTTFMVTATPAKCGTCAQELIVDKQGKVRCAEHPEIKPVGTGGFALLVLESTSGTKVTGPDGKSTEISPGQMAVLGGKAGAGPQVFTVSLAQVLRSSPLVNAFPQPLPSLGAILTTATQQQSLVASGSTRTTGTSGVAITSGGSLLAASSPPPTPAPISFVMASSTPGFNGGNSPSNARVGNPLDINTASGGIGGNTTVVNGGGPAGGFGGSVGGGAGGGGANPPSNTGQSGITANPNNPNNQNATPPTSVSVVSASVTPKVYDGTTTATISGASASVGGVGLVNETTGVFASKNVGSSISVATAISLTDLVRYSLTGQPSLFGDITVKALTMTGSIGGTKVYDGSRTALVTLGMLSGEVTGETLGTSTVVGTFNSKDVVGASSITAVYTLVNGASGELASNYSLGNDSLASTITAKAVTISVATPSTVTSKVYNGNRVASVTVGAVDGVIAGEVLGATTAVGTFVDKNIGTKSVMATYTLVDGVNPLHLASNYSLASETLSGTITAKDLSVFSAAVTTKAYDGNDAAVVTGAVLVGNSTTDIDGKFIGTETVTLNGGTFGTFASKNVGAGQAVATAMTLGGSDSGNYTLNTQPTLTGVITAKGLTMTGSTASSKVYDGSRMASVTLGALSGEVAGETLGATTVVGTFTDKNIGTKNVAAAYTLVNGLNGELASNYSLAGQTLTGTIMAKDLSVFSSAVATKVYNGSDAAVVTGAVLVGSSAADNDGKYIGSEVVTLTGAASGTFASKNVGAGQAVTTAMTLGGSDAGNYTLSTQPSLSGTITAKDLSVFSSAVTTKIYNGNDAAVVTGAVLVGNSSTDIDGKFIGTETVTLNGGTAGTFASKNVGAGQAVTTAMTLGGSDAGNYTLSTQPTLTGTIQAKGLSITSPSIAAKVYNGSAAAGVVTLGTLTGFVGTETVTASGTAANYSSENVGSYSSAITYALADGLNGGLASNYSLAAGSATGVITAKGLSITSPSIASKVYNGSAAAGVVTVGTLSGFVGSETVTASGLGADYSSANVGTYNGVAVGYTLGNGSNGGLASNYSLAAGSATGVITAKALTMTGSSAGNKVYDGTVTAAVALGTQSGEVAGEALGTTTVAGTFADRNVGPAKSVAVVYTLVDGANAAANYSLANDTLSANITAKALTVAGGAVTTKAYDGTTVATITGAGLQSAIAAGSGSSTDGKSYSVDSVTLAGGSTGTFERNLPGTLITVSTTMSVAGSGAGNYTLTQPTTLKGEITGSANLNRNGAAITVSSADYVHIRDTTATRMQDGLTISSSTGGVLLENSSFDGWMQRSTPNTKIDDGGVVTFQFTETASTAVNFPVLRLKMEANDPANVDMNKQFMLLGDYQVLLRRDPNGVPGSGDEVAQTLFSFPGSANDPSGIGSLAPSADLVIRDSASTQVKDLSWDTKEYSSLDGSGGALDSGNYAGVSGEFKGDNAASALDIATSSGGAAGKWDVVVSDTSLGGEGKVTDVRLKYNNNTKALIQGPNGVRLVNVIFEGMDAVEVAAGLNDKVLMSGTLVSDPNIGKMVVKAGQTLEAQFASDATMKEVRTSAGNAEILAGVVKDSASPTGYSFLSGPNRVLEMQSATIAGQLSLASHTIVFNNANITSGGVIDARSRDGMVNRTYGSVVPGTVSFMGANGNNFLNTANSASMSIANSGNIVSALSGGQMSENGAGGATVMNVGRVQ